MRTILHWKHIFIHIIVLIIVTVIFGTLVWAVCRLLGYDAHPLLFAGLGTLVGMLVEHKLNDKYPTYSLVM